MTTEPDELEGLEGEEDDVGLIGGGGPSATFENDDDTLDERGEDILEVDE